MLSKKLSKKTFVVSIFLIFIIIYACHMQISSMGYHNRIFVVADSTFWPEVAGDIREEFEAPIYMPIPEKTYDIDWIPLSKLNDFKQRMNIFLIGTSDQDNPTNNYLKQILPEQFKQGVENNEYFYLFQDNLFASGQVGLIMYAQDKASFLKNFAALKTEIFNKFTEKYYARIKKEMYSAGEQTGIQETLENNFGWSVRVQHDYFVAMQDIDQKYVWLRRIDPDRWLSMWEMNGDSSVLAADSLISIRNRVLGKSYEGDQVEKDDSYITIADFNGKPTVKMIGLWRNDSLLVGGPFRLYAIQDPQNSKVYFVDIAVMAPNKAKKAYLDQLEVMAHTFRVVESDK
jgi:hypothetical protein